MQTESSFLAILILATVLAIGFGYEKKSDFGNFASALKDAGRLRYGKRSVWQDSMIEASDPIYSSDYNWISDSMYPYVKRTPSTNKLIQSLKGAERLRFGRK